MFTRAHHWSQFQATYEGVSKSAYTESITKYMFTTINTHLEATQRVMVTKLTRLTHKIAIQLHLLAESCTICSSCYRRPVRKLLDTPSYIQAKPSPPYFPGIHSNIILPVSQSPRIVTCGSEYVEDIRNYHPGLENVQYGCNIFKILIPNLSEMTGRSYENPNQKS
jgi:hypothetical protein